MRPKYRKIVVKEIEREEVCNDIMCIKYHYPDLYDDTHTQLSEDTLGIKRAKVEKRILAQRILGANKYKGKPYFIQVPVFSGRKACIYALVNPINQNVFYIGVTILPLECRLIQHLGDYTNIKKRKAILNILEKFQKPIITPLCQCPVEVQFIEEKRWIMGARTMFKLTNKS